MLGSSIRDRARSSYMNMVFNGRAQGGTRGMGAAWITATAVLGAFTAAWWIELHPGVFTDDSGRYISQAVSGEIDNVKPFFFARFLQFITVGGRFLESAALVHAGFAVLILSRMFAVGWVNRAPVLAMALCAMLVLNPYFAINLFYVQNDLLFCLAMVAILVETIHCARLGRIPTGSMVMIVLMAPMALLFRQNGVLFLPFWVVSLFFLLPRSQAIKASSGVLASCLLALVTMVGVNTETTLNTKYSAVVHAIAGLSRPEYGKPLAANISPPTRELLGAIRLDGAVDHYSPRFWDFVGFVEGGPKLQAMSGNQQREIVDSFVRNDLWPNLPGVLGIRTELWASILLGRGYPVGAYTVPRWMPESLAGSKIANPPGGGVLTDAVRLQERTGLLRSALPGLLVLIVVALGALWRHNSVFLWASGLLLLQAAVIFLLAPSADTRYLMFLYLAPFMGLFYHAWFSTSGLSPRDPTLVATGTSVTKEVP